MSSTSRLGTAAVIPNSAALDKAVSHTASQKRKDLYYIKISLKLLISFFNLKIPFLLLLWTCQQDFHCDQTLGCQFLTPHFLQLTH